MVYKSYPEVIINLMPRVKTKTSHGEKWKTIKLDMSQTNAILDLKHITNKELYAVDTQNFWAYTGAVFFSYFGSNVTKLTVDGNVQRKSWEKKKNKLEKLPMSIGNLTSLIYLKLNDNNLKDLPETISKLKKIRELYLSNNKFNNFPEVVTNLTSLERLNIGGNQLKTLPKSIGKLKSLKKLNLRNNSITTLPESILNLPNLSKLIIADNPLNSKIFGSTPTDIIIKKLKKKRVDVK